MDPDERKDGISRRRMLKRIGAGTAVAWSAPILTSLRTPAFGQASPVCAPGCPACQRNGPPCLETCSCVGIPVECFCSDAGFCAFDFRICEKDADCDQYCEGFEARCAPCNANPGECMDTSCWCACSQGQGRIPRGRGIRVIRSSR
jgi:hypothetical protein